MSKIEPKTLKGFRDFLPEKQIPRQKMIDSIRASYERFGFEPLETPVLEYAETLVGKYGDEGDKLMYRFKDNGDRDVAMRYDLTIPLARVVAQNGEIKKPWKRYQISPVWRAENTQKGRYREFYQCDADIVGSSSPLADAEVLALAAATLKALGIRDFVIRINSREVINAFYDSLGLTEGEKISAIRAIDKIDKVGKDGVAEELTKNGIIYDTVQKLLAFAEVSIDAVKGQDELVKIGEELNVKEPLARLLSIVEVAYKLEPEARFVIDLSIARGLDYYTGIIFETTLQAAPQYGSVLSGGRYDGLVGMFSSKGVPAVGASIGLDRLYSALEELGLIKEERSTAKALIVNFDAALESDYLRLASELRASGVNTALYFETADLKKQLSYASEKGIRYAIIYGSNEAKEGKVIVKDLEKGEQEKVSVGDIAKYF
ncbi:MAG: histidine--tRNA ligase [Candidatus Taylorbacteria bacterium]|nr:histidine--tRNA ligase [Candidatus Taylorbacteria bacterium]